MKHFFVMMDWFHFPPNLADSGRAIRMQATAEAIGSKIKDHNNSWPQVLNLRPLDEKYAV